MNNDQTIVKMEQANRLLAECKTVPEAKYYHDMAEAGRQFARMNHLGLEAVNNAAEFKLRTERRLGDLLKQMAENGERETRGGDRKSKQSPDASTLMLNDIGVSKNQSSRWQTMAEVPEEQFEKFVAETKADKAELTSAGVIRLARHNEQAAIEPRPILFPTSQFSTIVVDPPWPIEKIAREVRPNQAALDYPTMSLDEISALPVSPLCFDDCHLYLWTTERFLPSAFGILETWGFRYIFTMVWRKPGGYQPFGLPQYNCEFVLFGRRGSLNFDDTKNFFTCFEAPRREHSRKPDEFYDLVRRVSPGPRLDMFSRERREGFEQHGKETNKFGAIGK